MALEIDQKKLDKLVTIVKQNPGNSETFYVEKSGIPRAQILRYLVKAEVLADPKLKIPQTGKAISKARAEGVRWPRIAARTGLSEAKAKELFEAETGTSARDSYSGRGRNWSGVASTSSTGTSGRRASGTAKKTTAKQSGTSGRRGSAGKKTAAASTPKRGAGRRTSRAAANPS